MTTYPISTTQREEENHFRNMGYLLSHPGVLVEAPKVTLTVKGVPYEQIQRQNGPHDMPGWQGRNIDWLISEEVKKVGSSGL